MEQVRKCDRIGKLKVREKEERKRRGRRVDDEARGKDKEGEKGSDEEREKERGKKRDDILIGASKKGRTDNCKQLRW